MKDDAIGQLSDQVMALTARMYKIERKRQYMFQARGEQRLQDYDISIYFI
jgi:hypothetical protein